MSSERGPGLDLILDLETRDVTAVNTRAKAVLALGTGREDILALTLVRTRNLPMPKIVIFAIGVEGRDIMLQNALPLTRYDKRKPEVEVVIEDPTPRARSLEKQTRKPTSPGRRKMLLSKT